MYAALLVLLFVPPLPSAAVPFVVHALPSVAVLTVRKHGLEKLTVAAGIVIADDVILTCRHVIAGRAGITVSVGGNELVGGVDWEDEAHDLAVVRVKSSGKLKAAVLAERSAVHGEDVTAVGHPLGYRNTVSRGIVSGMDREVRMPSGPLLKGLVQHSAAISRGNSGGPLLSADGQVIGMTVAYDSDGHQIAFAIPAVVIRRRLGGRYAILDAPKPTKVNVKPLPVRPMTFVSPDPMEKVKD